MTGFRLPCFNLLVLMLTTTLCLSGAHAQERLPPIAQATYSPASIQWQPHIQYERLTLKVGLPTGRVVQQEFVQGQVW